jgi:AcrR family transcriptional regulator
MTTTGLRARNKARTRDDIVQAALGLFESKGFDATTCEDIASAADVSVRTFFRYFETKLDVLAPGSDDEGPRAAIAELLHRPPTEAPVAALRHALAHPIAVVEGRRDLVVRQYRVITTTPSLESLRLQQFSKFEAPVAEALAARLGRSADELGVALLAAATGAALRLSIEWWVTAGAEPGTLRGILDEALALLTTGFDRLASP